jgi:multiple sugar transport system permease protein
MGTHLSSPTVVVAASDLRRSSARRRRIFVENVQAWLFLLPAIVLILVFEILPAFGAIWISAFRWDIVQGPFRGLENYAAWLWADPTRSEAFWKALSTTLTYLLITLPFQMALALAVAFVLFQKLRGRSFYRTLYYLPYVTSTVAAAAVFSWIFHPQYGFANQLLGLVGIDRLQWLQEPDGVFQMIGGALGVQVPDLLAGPSLALVAIAIFSVWHFLGFQIVIFLAGLGNIPAEYYEAARIDGANDRQIFTRITLPLLSPQIFFVFTIASIGVLRAFNEIYVMTNGGPLDTTRTINMLVFRTFFQQGQLGLGSALAVILTVIILIFTLIQFRVFERRVHYG